MNKEKLEKQLSDIDLEILSDLKNNLAEEMSKPADERDENLITELEEMISETEEEIISASKKRSLESVMKMLDEYEEPKHIKLYKRLSIVAACLLLVIGLNTASLKVLGQNLFSERYQPTQNGIYIFPEQAKSNSNIEPSDSDPYGMKAKCAEYGFIPYAPSYIPEGFVLDEIAEDSNDSSDSVLFVYKKGKVTLSFCFKHYEKNSVMPVIGIPTKTFNITEEQINGHPTYILKEDKRFEAAFREKRIDYTIYANGLDYDECDKILENIS